MEKYFRQKEVPTKKTKKSIFNDKQRYHIDLSKYDGLENTYFNHPKNSSNQEVNPEKDLNLQYLNEDENILWVQSFIYGDANGYKLYKKISRFHYKKKCQSGLASFYADNFQKMAIRFQNSIHFQEFLFEY